MYYGRVFTNLCDGEGHLKPRDVKVPIAVNSSAWDRSGTLGAVVRCTTKPRGGGKTHIKERFLVQAPLNCTWNHGRWTSLSKFTIIWGSQPRPTCARRWRMSPVHGNERRCKSSRRGRRPKTQGIRTRMYTPQKSGKPPGASWRSWCCRQGATQGRSNHHAPQRGLCPRRSRRSMRRTPWRSVRSRRTTRLPSRRHFLRSAGSIKSSSRRS